MLRLLRAAFRIVMPVGIPLAWRQLVNERKRLAVAIAGMTFGIMLMLFQLGLYNGIMAMVVLPHDSLGGDLVIISPNYEYFGSSLGFSRRRLAQASNLPEVSRSSPVYFGFFDWANPVTGRIKTILTMGIDPDQNPFINPDVIRQLPVLHNPRNVLFDTLSQSDYGPVVQMFHEHGAVDAEIEHKHVRVAGLFTMGHTLAASASLVLSDEAYFRLRPDKARNMANVGLIWLKPGVNRDIAAERLRTSLPGDVEVLSRETFLKREQDYWAQRTPIGFVTTAGMLVGMFVGAIVVYQILYTDVNDNLEQYATLKAIGLSDAFFVLLVLEEALILTALSYVPGVLFTAALNYEAQTSAHIPTTLSAKDLGTVFAAVSATCLLAGILATRKLRTADPADVF